MYPFGTPVVLDFETKLDELSNLSAYESPNVVGTTSSDRTLLLDP
jgi:D-alanyl-D-alanine dipeptidase